jgi:hypothetical protein
MVRCLYLSLDALSLIFVFMRLICGALRRKFLGYLKNFARPFQIKAVSDHDARANARRAGSVLAVKQQSAVSRRG